ncbi:hypothetical protein ACTTAL_12810 [Rhodobacter capsulatus]
MIDGLIERLKKPDLVAAFIEAAQKDRRTEAKARATAARDRDRAQAAIERLQKSLIAGRVEEDFFDREIIPLRQGLAAAQERRAAAPGSRGGRHFICPLRGGFR